MRGVRAAFVFLAVLVVGYCLYSAYSESSKLFSGSFRASGYISPSTVSPGAEDVVFKVTDVRGVDWKKHAVYPVDYRSSSSCGSASGYCPYARFVELHDTCRSMAAYVGSAASGKGVYYNKDYDTWAFDEWDTWTGHTGYALWGVSDGGVDSVSELDPFSVWLVKHINFYIDTYRSSGAVAYPVVAVCADSAAFGRGYVDVYSSDCYAMDSQKALSINGYTYYCVPIRLCKSYGTDSFYVSVDTSDSEVTTLYIVITNTCFTKRVWGIWDAYCDDSKGYTTSGRLMYVKINEGFVRLVPVNYDSSVVLSSGRSDSIVADFVGIYDGDSLDRSLQWTFDVSPTAPPGTYSIGVLMAPTAECYMFGTYLIDDWEIYCLSNNCDSSVASFTVVDVADSVSLSNVEQENDDSAVKGTIKVTGGTVFNYVKVYIDGSYKDTVYKSEFSCSGTTCTYSFNYSMYNKSDGSHTLKAELYVDGSKKDTATASFNYYQVGIRSVSATTSSASFECKGGYDEVRVYIDSTSCVAKGWTSFSPSSAHSWRSKSVSYNWPSCASSEGTHTVYVELRDESGHTVRASDTVTIDYDYSLSNPQPSYGEVYYAQADGGSVPSDFRVNTSADYYTDAPSATLKLYLNGSRVKSKSVSGSGTFSYELRGSDGIMCGDNTVSWELGGGEATESTSFTVYCVQAEVVSPSGTVTLPSSDGSTVSSGSYVVVEADVSSTPYDPSLSVEITLDGQQGETIACDRYCARFDASGWQCGSSHTAGVTVFAGGDIVASATSSFTVECAHQYVDIVQPGDGTVFHIYRPLQEEEFDLSVNWASAEPSVEFRVVVNGREVSPPERSDCSYGKCYVLRATEGLVLGDNTVEVELLGPGRTPVAEDSVSFRIQYWSFEFGEDWGRDPPVVYLIDRGEPDHAGTCEYELGGTTGEMTAVDLDDALRWEVAVSEDVAGSTLSVRCYYEGTVVFEDSYQIAGAPDQPGDPSPPDQPGDPSPPDQPGDPSPPDQPGDPSSPDSPGDSAPSDSPSRGLSGSYRSKAPVDQGVAFPVFPDSKKSGRYVYSVYAYSGAPAESVFRDVYVSGDHLCFVPKTGAHLIYYYRADFVAFPTTGDEADQVISSVGPEDFVDVQVEKQGSAYCIPLQGTAVIYDAVDGGATGEYYFIVLDTVEGTSDMNLAFVGVFVALLIGYILYQKGVFGRGKGRVGKA